MNGAFTLFRREMKAYLTSPIAAIVIIAFLLLSGGVFMSQFFLVKALDMRAFFALLPVILGIVLPAVSMRLWAEDRQLNTLELLLSLPLKPAALVAGKFGAAKAFLAMLLASTWTIPLMLAMLGKPDLGPVASGYLGAFLLGMLFLSLGQLISGFCRDQIVAFILTLFCCQALYLIGLDFIAATIDGWWPGLGGFLQGYLGIAHHVAGFEKGVVDLRDAAYFLLLSGVFLALNGVWIEGRLRPRARVAFATACGLSIGIALAAQAVLRELPLGRFDWTEGKSYTVAPASRELLRGLEVPVAVKLYLSAPEKMPTAMRTMERDLKDKLEELKLASGGKLNYTVTHMDALAAMEADPAKEGGSTEEKMGRKGIRPFQVQSIEADEVGVRVIYAAAAISYKDRPDELIPQIVPNMLDQFEYLVLSRVYRLTLPEPARVAIFTPPQQQRIDPALRAALEQSGMQVPEQVEQEKHRFLPAVLEQEGYRVDRLRLENQGVPAGTDALVLVDPGELNDRQRYEIGRFVAGGGSLLAAAQRYQYEYVQQGRGIYPSPRERAIGLDPLLAAWGIEVRTELLLDEQAGVITASAGAGVGPFSFAVPIKAPVHVLVNPEQMNQQLNLSSRLPALLYLGGSPLSLNQERIKQAGVTVETLFRSSRRSWAVPPAEYEMFSPDRAPASQTGPFPLAVLAKGTFPDPFEGKEVPAWPSDPQAAEPPVKTEPAPAPAARKPAQVILLGCSEMFRDELLEAPGHLAFFMNAVDTLVSGGKLVGIQSKQPVQKLMGLLSPAKKAWFRFLTLGLMPAAILLLSVAHAAWRRRRREAPQAV